mmetsp:Transcript_12693/g.23790  ORF Transcript_12693/g.23790 Transcript_12693/m.23790 type:complete len:311 (-) Transcript_12693:1509-2441(-)
MAGKGKQFLSPPSTTAANATSAQRSTDIPTREQIQAKRKSIPKNRALVDANKAEIAVLDLLSLCADTTRHLEELARGDDMVSALAVRNVSEKEEGRMRGVGVEKKRSRSASSGSIHSAGSSSSNEEKHRVTLIRRNGLKFQRTLKKIHDLLAPHASSVVNYSKHQELAKKNQSIKQEETEKIHKADSDKEQQSDVDVKMEDVGKLSSSTATESVDGEAVDASETDKETEKEMDKCEENKADDKEKSQKEESREHQNMYYSRLEMKLANDRRNLLKDMLRLEKQLQHEEQAREKQDSDQNLSISNKRKRQD